MQLHDRVVLITGGKRIGADIALALAARGADVALCYRESRAEAEATAHAVVKLGRRGQLIQVDLRSPADCRRAVAETVSSLGRLDVLINMASVYARKPYLELTEEDWERSLGVDLRAAHLCAQAAVPHMRTAGQGRIVNFTDWVAASRRPRYPGYLPYYVAKMGVIALTESHRKSSRPSYAPLRWAGGADPRRSAGRSCSSWTATSSPAKPFGWTAAGTCDRGHHDPVVLCGSSLAF
jgi:NAD(P)-dependent dehydrogenase (short-subunit alcohol dehydrogenase family)